MEPVKGSTRTRRDLINSSTVIFRNFKYNISRFLTLPSGDELKKKTVPSRTMERKTLSKITV